MGKLLALHQQLLLCGETSQLDAAAAAASKQEILLVHLLLLPLLLMVLLWGPADAQHQLH
jgi:hypothetical protein